MSTPCFNIAAVERDTGLSKDVLRMWERRYGFPTPDRDAHGERLYPGDQVERLRLIKRLMDQGHRPGKLMACPLDALAELSPRRASNSDAPLPGPSDDELEALLALVKQHDGQAYSQALQQRLARQGLQSFVQYTIAPLTQRVGQAWEEGRFAVFEEHLFTELTKRVLRQAIAALPTVSRSPRVLLTSVPDEQHVLGLLMVEALLCLEGAECIPLGTQMPLVEIARAAAAHRADIVALSFSVAFPARQLPGLLQQLGELLPADCTLWVGGAGARKASEGERQRVLLTLDDALAALSAWRQAPTVASPD
ncbi:MAG: MerR family transcriptional regulator [Dechloromonas sp.]|nr:MerR family transcriptional regulator [Dechloromonas sp.]